MKKLILLTLSILPAWTNAQLKELWKTSVDLNTSSFHVQGIKSDSQRNMYIYGERRDTMYLQVLDSNGNELWVINQHNNNVLRSIVKDVTITDSFLYGIGQIFLPATTSSVVIFKYSKSGQLIWFQEHNDPNVIGRGRPYQQEDYKNHPAKILIDPDGNLYGFYSGMPVISTFSTSDILCIKYSKEGNRIWTKGSNILYGSVNTRKWFRNLLYRDSSIYILADVQTPLYLRSNVLLYQLDTAGNIGWHQFEGLGYSWNFSRGMSDDMNHLYVIAETFDTTTSRKSSSCIKFSKGGNRIWRKDINLNEVSEDVPISIHSDDRTDLYISAVNADSSSPKTLYQYKLDSSGRLQWLVELNDNIKTETYRLYNSWGGESYIQRRAYLSSGLNNERDVIITSSDSLQHSNTTTKVLHCGTILWDHVATPRLKSLGLLLMNEQYISFLASDSTLLIIKFQDTTSGKNIESLNVTSIGARKNDISWVVPSIFTDSIVIEKSTDGQVYVELVILPSEITYYTDTQLTPNTTYFYRAYSRDYYGSRCPDNKDSATTWDNVGTYEVNNQSLKVYPNPVQNILILNISEKLTYEILGINGQIQSGEVFNGIIDCSTLISGMYVLRVKSERDAFIPIKFIKL